MHHSLTLVQGYSKAQAYKDVTGSEELSDNCLIKINRLSLNKWLLQYFVTHILNKSRNVSYANELEQYIMARAINSQPFNVPYLLIQRMANIVKKEKSLLPYAAIICKI